MYQLSFPGSRALPRLQSVVGSNSTQGSSFLHRKRVVLGVVDLFCFDLVVDIRKPSIVKSALLLGTI